ncbi:MAG TPA: hypothetical protein VL171_00880 [Verrucomicrobiae bacterium]|nr:hypothetical protein [Verrucomicrobiae bacterium]
MIGVQTFAPAPNWLLRRREVSTTAKLVYAGLAQYAGTQGVAYPSLGRLAGELRERDRLEFLSRYGCKGNGNVKGGVGNET